MARISVYHGGYCPVTEPELRPGRHTKDFGPGFYCTVIREQAQRWARRFQTPVVSTYDLRLDTRLDILEFSEMTDPWLDFIVECRSGVPHGHDIVIGAMADDQIYNYIADFVDCAITREQFWGMARFKYPTHQICFCSEAALRCLTYRTFEEVV